MALRQTGHILRCTVDGTAYSSILGDVRILPLYSTVSGNGTNAAFTIVKFVGIRITDVKLTGKSKQLIVQPATVVTCGGIPSTDPAASSGIYSPAWLVK